MHQKNSWHVAGAQSDTGAIGFRHVAVYREEPRAAGVQGSQLQLPGQLVGAWPSAYQRKKPACPQKLCSAEDPEGRCPHVRGSHAPSFSHMALTQNCFTRD